VSALRYAWAEIFNAKRFSLFFILNLALGMFGFLSLEFFKDSLEATMQDRSRAVLGADLAAQARRALTPEETQILTREIGDAPKTEILEIFSMAAKKGGRSTLVQVRAIAPEFPFYGQIQTSPAGLTSATLAERPSIWIYPELASQLGVQVGDTLRLGEADLEIAGIVIDDSASGISTSMAPRIYISTAQFPKTQLLKQGSIAWRQTLFKLSNLDKIALDRLRDRVYRQMPSADVQVYTHEHASEQMGRLLKYLNDFLGLAALVSLFICALGIGFLCFTFLQGRLKNIAILVSLGMSHRRALGRHALQIILLAALGSVVAGTLAYAAVPLFQGMAKQFVNFDIVFRARPAQLGLVLAACLGGSLLVLLPLILRVRHVNPAGLLHEQALAMPAWDVWSLAGFLPLILAFFGLAVWQIHSLYDGAIFFGGFTGAAVLFYAIGFALIPVARKLPQPRWLAARWAIRDLTRLKFATLSCFLALAVSLLLLNLIPQIERSIREEIKNPDSSKLPGLFLFDIQEEQVPELQTLLTANHVELKVLSPLVRARLIGVNNEAFDKGTGTAPVRTHEEEEEMQFRNRGFNLSYREHLNASETLTAGRGFSAQANNDMAELSVEDGFAERLHLKLGDVLKFDVQNVAVQGRIVNLRKVQWTSFQPNFFVLVQPGFLEGAPKTFLATLPKLPQNEKLALQDKIVEKLPNVSMIDIARLVERLQDIVFHISWTLKIMLGLTLLVGFSVLFSIASQQAAARKWDIGLLKSLGGSLSTITASLLLQFALIAALAAGFGFAVSLIFSRIISHYLFNNLWFFDWRTPTLLLVASVALSVLVTWISVSRTLKTQARELLNR